MFRKLNQAEYDSIRTMLSSGILTPNEWYAVSKLMQNYQDVQVELAEHEATLRDRLPPGEELERTQARVASLQTLVDETNDHRERLFAEKMAAESALASAREILDDPRLYQVTKIERLNALLSTAPTSAIAAAERRQQRLGAAIPDELLEMWAQYADEHIATGIRTDAQAELTARRAAARGTEAPK